MSKAITDRSDYRQNSAVGGDPVSKKVPKQDPNEEQAHETDENLPSHLNGIHYQICKPKIYEGYHASRYEIDVTKTGFEVWSR